MILDIHMDENTEFAVQVGKGRGRYNTKYTIKGQRSLVRAVYCYLGIYLGPGGKKRLILPAYNNRVLARAAAH